MVTADQVVSGGKARQEVFYSLVGLRQLRRHPWHCLGLWIHDGAAGLFQQASGPLGMSAPVGEAGLDGRQQLVQFFEVHAQRRVEYDSADEMPAWMVLCIPVMPCRASARSP